MLRGILKYRQSNRQTPSPVTAAEETPNIVEQDNAAETDEGQVPNVLEPDSAAEAVASPGGVTEKEMDTGNQVAPASPAVKEEAAVSEKGDPEKAEGSMFSSLFNDVVEKEETPRDRLIKELPEVTMQELFDEMQEVNMIMQDWQQL